MALQTGEIGPIAQVIAGIDIAMWDLAARMQGKPLYQVLGAAPARQGPGLRHWNQSRPAGEVRRGALRRRPSRVQAQDRFQPRPRRRQSAGDARGRGQGRGAHLRCQPGPVGRMRRSPSRAPSAQSACSGSRRRYASTPPLPIGSALAKASPVPLAGGENFQGSQFDDAIADDVLKVIQPDVTKWGGITGNFQVAKATVAAGKRYCPHFFGGGVSILVVAATALRCRRHRTAGIRLPPECRTRARGRRSVAGGRRAGAGAHRCRTGRDARHGAARSVPHLAGQALNAAIEVCR